MKSSLDQNTLTLFLEGRIDSANSAQTEQEIFDLIRQNPGCTPAFDARDLAYISSAGLRVLMKVRRQAGSPVPVYNVSPEVYEILEVTGFTDLLDVHKRLRSVSVEGCERIGQGGNGSVYRLDEDTIVKVYKPWMQLKDIQRERDFARTAFVNGIPSVIAYDVVQVQDCLGVVFEMLKSDTLGHAMAKNPEKLEEYVDKYVALAKQLHSTHVPEGSFTPIQDVMNARVEKLDPWCSREEIDLLHTIVDSIPRADTVTHNDLHPGNIMIQDGELVLIDMPELTMGPPVCDMTSIYRDMIAAPATSSSQSVESSVGMPKELIVKTGNMFFQKYTGIGETAQLQEYYKKLGLLFAFNVVMIPGAGSERAMNMADDIMNRLLRGVVVPNQDAIRHLYRVL